MRVTTTKSNNYFADHRAIAAFDQAFVKHVSGVLKDFVSLFVSPENTQRLRHGGDWRHPGLPHAISGGVHQHTSEVLLKFQDVVNHDLSSIERHVQKITQDMGRQFQQMMYATVSAACDQTGNAVDAAAQGGPLEGLAAMLEKIQFSADKHGKVTEPQIHLSPEMLQKLREAEKSASPELLRRIDDARARNTAEAIGREAQRKARFSRYGETA
jgi:hypothetical protein